MCWLFEEGFPWSVMNRRAMGPRLGKIPANELHAKEVTRASSALYRVGWERVT